MIIFLFFFLFHTIYSISIIFHLFVMNENGKISKTITRSSNIIEIVTSSPRIFISSPPFSSLLPYRFVSLSSPALLPLVLLPRCCASTRRSFPFFTPASFLFYRFHRFLPAFPFSIPLHVPSLSSFFHHLVPPSLSLPSFFLLFSSLNERPTSIVEITRRGRLRGLRTIGHSIN